MLSKHNKYVHLVGEKIYLCAFTASRKKTPLPAFAAKKTSRKFSQDSCKPEKIRFTAIITAVRSIAISVCVCLSLT